jgi:hypothetical protein
LYAARIAVEALSVADAGRPLKTRDVLLMPLRDAGVAALFWAGLFGRKTVWRGRMLLVGERTLIAPALQSPSIYRLIPDIPKFN